MDTLILGLLAETFIHPGMGSVGGAIDLPVAREAATDYPVIAGSSLKGAIKDKARQEQWPDVPMLEDGKPVLDKDGKPRLELHPEVKHYFGKQDNAGQILVSDARLLLLPVRSLNGSYKWVTCPHLIERLVRDLERAGRKAAAPTVSEVKTKNFLGAGSGTLYLEERRFERQGDLPTDSARALGKLVAHEQTRKRLASQVVILNDDDFIWFARYGLAVQARNVLDENKKSENLWYEETLPPDSLFYALIAGRKLDAVDQIKKLMTAKRYLQTGGNETVGQGWFAIQVLG
ncbi:MAG: type III-B CRISPR module RAMP protein Cmr4 [Acidobacteria bacterium]|nr:type III-B CRISPR module RAMP protein Cmr4 [Acidobacteriota bacterium]